MSTIGRRNRRLAVLVGLTGVAVFSAAGSAAATVDHYTFDFQNSDTISCSQFNPAWTFSDHFTDTYHVTGSARLDAQGNLLSFVDHYTQTSVDTNSVTGRTLEEHNHFVLHYDAHAGTLAVSGAFGSAQAPHRGSVIRAGGHEVYLNSDGSVLFDKGPDVNHDIDFCRALAP